MHKLGEPLHWKGPAPIPDVQVRARPHGAIQWQCPDCGHLHGKATNFWRRGMVQCTLKGCRHKFRVGVGFSSYNGVLRCLYMGNWQGNIANRINPSSMEKYHPVGFIYGPLDWECPACQQIRTDTVDFRIPTVTCCNQMWIVQLLLYRPQGSKNITPYDWSVYAPENYPSTTSSQVGQS